MLAGPPAAHSSAPLRPVAALPPASQAPIRQAPIRGSEVQLPALLARSIEVTCPPCYNTSSPCAGTDEQLQAPSCDGCAMRKALWIIALAAAACLSINPASAGVYCSIESIGLPQSPQEATYHISELRAIPTPLLEGAPPDPDSLRFKFLQRTAELEVKERNDNLSTQDRIDLGGCYLRLRRFSDAVR